VGNSVSNSPQKGSRGQHERVGLLEPSQMRIAGHKEIGSGRTGQGDPDNRRRVRGESVRYIRIGLNRT
jgi:hypothetical protein